MRTRRHFRWPVGRRKIQVDAVALEPFSRPQLAANVWSRSFQQNEGVGLGRVPEPSEPRDFRVVVSRDRIAIDGRRPEAGERRRVVRVDDDFLEPAHAVRPFLAMERRKV